MFRSWRISFDHILSWSWYLSKRKLPFFTVCKYVNMAGNCSILKFFEQRSTCNCSSLPTWSTNVLMRSTRGQNREDRFGEKEEGRFFSGGDLPHLVQPGSLDHLQLWDSEGCRHPWPGQALQCQVEHLDISFKCSDHQVEFYGFFPWIVIQRITLPLCVFFRFHSTVIMTTNFIICNVVTQSVILYVITYYL